MKTAPQLSIILLTVDTPGMTAACLRSVFRNTTVPFEVIVVDNSEGKRIGRMLKEFPKARVIRNRKNAGFAAGSNQGIRMARGEYFCFLNSDTLVPPGWAQRLIDAAQHPGVGAVGPASEELFKGTGGRRWPPALRPTRSERETARVDEAFQKKYAGQLESVRWLHGFCLLIRRLVMAEIGPFDEGYFFGVEDLDYAFQLRMNGYRLLRVHFLFVHHRQGASSNPEGRRKLVRRSEEHFLLKWTTPLTRNRLDYPALFRSVDRMVGFKRTVPKKRPAGPKVRSGSGETAGRLIRTGYGIASKTGLALARFSDMAVFDGGARLARPWQSFQGGVQPKGTSASLRRLTAQLREQGLLAEPKIGGADRPEVSVLLVAHNAERWIDQTLDSVLAQDHPNFELLALDDGSTDRTGRIIRKYLWHPRLRFFHHPLQAGAPLSRNRLLRAAHGRLIAICGSQDIMLAGHLRTYARFMERRPQTGWVYGHQMEISHQGRPLELERAVPPDGKVEFRENVILHAGAMIRKEAMERVGGYDQTLLSEEDYRLALKILLSYRIAVLPGRPSYMRRVVRWDGVSRINPWVNREAGRRPERHSSGRS